MGNDRVEGPLTSFRREGASVFLRDLRGRTLGCSETGPARTGPCENRQRTDPQVSAGEAGASWGIHV
jgi:hypothetical protein